MISDTSFIVVDLETTGLVPTLDKIIEVAAVKVRNGQVVGEYESLVNPNIFIPDEITNFTGISTDMVKSAPSFDVIAPKLLDFMEDSSVFVAHNVDFDRGFINNHLEQLEQPALPHPYLCTIQLARHVHPNLSKYNLGALSEFFSVELPQAHRAIHDARATADLFVKFMNSLSQGGLKKLGDIPVIQNYQAPSDEASEGQIALF